MHDAQLPAGPQAQALFDLWLLLLVVCTLVFIAVMTALALALRRAPRATSQTAPDMRSLAQAEPRIAWPVGIAIAVSGLLLFGLLVASIFTDYAIARLPLADALHIELTGHDWWWEARYRSDTPSRGFATANDIVIPAGVPIQCTFQPRAASVSRMRGRASTEVGAAMCCRKIAPSMSSQDVLQMRL